MANTKSEFLVNTQPHARNGTFRIIVRDLEKNVIVNQLHGGQVQKPQTMQILENGHLVIGYSHVRPWRFDFMTHEGEPYNTVETDSDKCMVLPNGLFVEIISSAKQTIVKQIPHEHKSPHIVQIYDFAAQWIDLLDGTDRLVAQKDGSLFVLHLGTSIPEFVLPLHLTNLVLENRTLMGTTPQGDFVQKVHLHNLIDNGFTRTETTPILVKKYKHNDIKLIPINARYTLYVNHQKHSMRDVGSSVFFLVDWNKRQTIWHTSQDITVVATSSDAYFVYCDNNSFGYHFMVCGSSLAIPIPLLTGLKPKGMSRFTSSGMFVFHGEKKIVVMDIETSTVLQQFDVTRHVCDLMALSKWNYKPKPKPVESSLLDSKEESNELQAMVDAKDIETPPPPPVDTWIPPPPPPLPEPVVETKATQTEPQSVDLKTVETTTEVPKVEVLKMEVKTEVPVVVVEPKVETKIETPPTTSESTATSTCSIM